MVISPEPGTYNLPSDFEKEKLGSFTKNGKMFSFGAPREAYDRVYYKERIPHDRQIPGPGSYELDATLGKNSKKFSLVGRIPSECKCFFIRSDRFNLY